MALRYLDDEPGATSTRVVRYLDEPEVAPRQPEQPTQEDFLREAAQDMPWGERQIASMGLQLMKGYQGLKGLVGGDVNKEVVQAADVAADEAPVGAIAGEVVKYAPLMAVPGGIFAQAGTGALMGAAYDPTGRRLESGLLEGALSGAGAAIGKALPVIAGKGANVVNSLRERLGAAPTDRYYGGLDKARDALQKIIGEGNLAAARTALSQPGDVRTAQALVDNLPVGAAENIAVLDRLARREGISAAADPIEAAAQYAAQRGRQKLARESTMAQIARGGNVEQSAASVKGMREGTEAALGPIREARLGEAGVGANTKDLLARADVLDAQALQFGGTSAEAARLRQMAQQIGDWGYSPLDVRPITGRISQILDDPKLGSSENVERVLSDVSGRIGELVRRGGGTIDPNALYMLRKEGINEAVSKLLSGADPAMSKRLSAKLSTELKPLIDDAIENSGAKGWKGYITQYSKELENADRVELASALRSLQADNPKQFLKVMRGDNPELVAKYGNWATIKDALGASDFAKASGVAKEMTTDRTIKEMAQSSEAKAAVAKILEGEGIERSLPNMLNRYVVLANTALKEGKLKMDSAMYREIEKAMRDPKAMAKLVDMLPPTQRSQMIGFMQQIGKTGAVAGAVAGEEFKR